MSCDTPSLSFSLVAMGRTFGGIAQQAAIPETSRAIWYSVPYSAIGGGGVGASKAAGMPFETFSGENQRTAKGASGKGPRQKTSKIAKKCQNIFRHCSTFFAQGQRRQKSSKNVQNIRQAPKYHTKGCSHSSVDSPGARTVVFAAVEAFSSCEFFRTSIARTPFCAVL